MADCRLAVLLAHLAPEQQGASAHPGSRSEAPWFAASSGPLVIVGGVCLDIQAQPSNVDIQRGTSVPGKVRQVPGGVGRNIAEALSGLLPSDRPAPVFISLVGDDTAGSFLTASLRRLRLDLTQLITCHGAPTPSVSAVLDRGGEVAAAVADVTSVEQHLTPERLRECEPQIQTACLLLAEGNLSTEALEYVSRTAARARVPVFLEPVSVPKAARLMPSLPYATFVSPNAAELMSLADDVRRAAGLPLLPRPTLADDYGEGGSSLREPVVELLQQMAGFAEVVLAAGTSCVVLTLGSLGAALITYVDADAAPGPRASLQPLDACSRTGGGCGGAGARHFGTAPTAAAVSPTGRDTVVVQHNAGAGLEAATQPHAAKHAARCAGAAVPVREWGFRSCEGDYGSFEAAHYRPRGLPLSRQEVSSSGLAETSTSAAAGSAAAPAPAAAATATTASAAEHESAAAPAPAARPAVPHHVPARALVHVAHLRALPAEVVSVNGAGDTLVAGMVAALLQQQEPVHALAYGMAAAKRAVESHRNVPADLDFSSLRADADAVVATLQRHLFPSILLAV